MPKDGFTLAQQENVITVLAHSDKFGKIVARVVDPSLFEGDYRTVAERCIEYWEEHGEAPKVHTHDLFSDILEDKGNRRATTFRSILNDMVRLAEDVNSAYVISELSKFTRLQKLKDAIVRSAERLNQPTAATIDEVEDILNDILRARDFELDEGMKLRDIDRLLEYMDTTFDEFTTGIDDFDRRKVVPYRGSVFLLLGGKGRGKSWWLINNGKRALMSRKRVLHITLEMSEEQTAQRYLQSLFAIPKRAGEEYYATTFEVEEGRYEGQTKLVGFGKERLDIDFAMNDPEIKIELEARIEALGGRIDNLIIKRFPTGQLTPNGLRAYLDSLEQVTGFIPDMVVMDYMALMKTDKANMRHSLVDVVEQCRAICIERNFAFVTAHQLSKQGFESRFAGSTNVAEAWGIIHAADTTITHSATQMEQRMGLGRLFVDHAREEGDKFGVLITQNYGIGQFVLESIPMPAQYWDVLDELKKEECEDGMSGDTQEDDD